MPQGLTPSFCRGIPDNAGLRLGHLAEVQASRCPPGAPQAAGLLLLSPPFSSGAKAAETQAGLSHGAGLGGCRRVNVSAATNEEHSPPGKE